MGYSVKAVKSFQGREGYGFECTLYLDGKKIGTVTDTAGGGMVDFYLDKGEEKKLDDFCLTLPKWGSEFGDGKKEYDTDKDIYVTELVNRFEQDKKWKRACKKQTIFIVEGMEKGKFYTQKTPFNELTKASIIKEFKGKKVEFINERYL